MKKVFKENWAFIIVCSFFAVYYLYRMLAMAPWYDELYTYIEFIDRGAWYSMTNWPAPNNHIFFSVSSTLADLFGTYIGLRGISFLAAVSTLVVLYLLLKDACSPQIALFGVMTYGMFFLVNNLAVQGRGYSLATFFLVMAMYSGYHICYKVAERKYYILWALSLCLGLYTLISSLYWVCAVCICCGLILLLMKHKKKLLNLIAASACAAVSTFILYSIMWLSMGAQRLIETEYPGASPIRMVFEHPRACLMWGINFMRTDRNLQGFGRDVFLRDFQFFGRDILNAFINVQSIPVFYVFVIIVVVMTLLFFSLVIYAKKKKVELENMPALFIVSFAGISFLCVFLCLFIQSDYPFTRVFSFLGVFLCMILCVFAVLIKYAVGKVKSIRKKVNWFGLINIPIFVIAIFVLTSAKYNYEYDYVDYYAADAIAHAELKESTMYLACDVYAKQQVVYHYEIGKDMELVEEKTEPEVIIIRNEGITGSWYDLISPEEYAGLWVEEREIIYENQIYRVYR